MEVSDVTLIKIGETKKLNVTILPEDATDKSVTWSSSNPAVCTVTSNGDVIALGNGTSVVLAITNDGALPVTCVVTVDTELAGIEEVNLSDDNPSDIYTSTGIRVRSRATSVDGLPRGVYIVNGKKVVVK